MNPLDRFVGSVAIVVSSCDAFFDAWQPFAYFFHRFWPDCALPIYLIVNELQVRSDFILPLAVGSDRGWASNMKTALQKIAKPRVLYFQEDYFLNGPVDEARLAEDLEYAIGNDVDAFCFRARSEVESGFQPITDRFGLVPVESDGRTRCQLTLWKRESFLMALREGESAWEMEARGSERTRGMQVVSYSSREMTPVPYLMSAIVRGLWTPEALAMCEEASVAIDPPFRGVYTSQPLLRRWRRARSRKALQRELAKYRDRTIHLEKNVAPKS